VLIFILPTFSKQARGFSSMMKEEDMNHITSWPSRW